MEYDYLRKSSNVVKSNTKRNKIFTILSYLLIWSIAMIVFWFFTNGSNAMGYSLLYLWIILPVTTFFVSVIIGINDFWGIRKWVFTLIFGVMYMLAEYGTFKMANNIAFNKLNTLDWGMIADGTIISAIGMLIGSLFNKKRNKTFNGGANMSKFRTVVAVIIMILCGVAGLFLGATLNNAIGGGILGVLISGIACIIYVLDNQDKK